MRQGKRRYPHRLTECHTTAGMRRHQQRLSELGRHQCQVAQANCWFPGRLSGTDSAGQLPSPECTTSRLQAGRAKNLRLQGQVVEDLPGQLDISAQVPACTQPLLELSNEGQSKSEVCLLRHALSQTCRRRERHLGRDFSLPALQARQLCPSQPPQASRHPTQTRPTQQAIAALAFVARRRFFLTLPLTIAPAR